MPRLTVLILLALAACALSAGASPSASALTIIRKYVAPGERFESLNGKVIAGQPPANTVGDSTLVAVFNAAANSWEHAIRDSHTVTIQFGWSPIPIGSGVHTVLSQGGSPNRVTEAIVYFDNDGSTTWFLDPTPGEHAEYRSATECYTNLGGGRLNSGRVLSNPVGAARTLDLLTIATHELGHALALSTWNALWASKTSGGGIHVNLPRPFPGSVIPTNPDGHLALEGALMGRGLLTGQRKLLSLVDVLPIAEMADFGILTVNLKLNPNGRANGNPKPELQMGRMGAEGGSFGEGRVPRQKVKVKTEALRQQAGEIPLHPPLSKGEAD